MPTYGKYCRQQRILSMTSTRQTKKYISIVFQKWLREEQLQLNGCFRASQKRLCFGRKALGLRHVGA